MDNEPEVIREQMSQTRASLTEKLETLEQQVVDTVQGATASVTETVETVKEAVRDTMATVKGSVDDTVAAVKDSLDVGQLVRRHPWVAVGASLAGGFILGSLLVPAKRSRTDGRIRPHRFVARPNGAPTDYEALAKHPDQERSKPSWLSELAQTFENETRQLKGLVLAASLGAARDLLSRQVPETIAPQLREIIDNVTSKLGGQPIHGSVLKENPQEQWR
jgi:ElaB/YqjD/DUF883 family membrane-anchored ribosome-binding protein